MRLFTRFYSLSTCTVITWPMMTVLQETVVYLRSWHQFCLGDKARTEKGQDQTNRGILISKSLKYLILHAPKFCSSWFTGFRTVFVFALRPSTFPLHVGACGRGRRTKIWFGDNFWLRCSIHLRSAHLNCIMDDLFRDTPYWPYLVRQIRQKWPNTVIGTHIWANQIWLGGVSLKRSINKQLRQWNSCWCL